MYTYAVSYYLHYVYILCLWCMLYEKKEEEEEVIYARTRRNAGPVIALTSEERYNTTQNHYISLVLQSPTLPCFRAVLMNDMRSFSAVNGEEERVRKRERRERARERERERESESERGEGTV